MSLSPASIRGVMQELEERGLLTHPHTSAGRIPTETGLRLFVDGIMHSALPQARERAAIEAQLKDRPVEEALAAATATLSGLSACAGVVLAPKNDFRLRQLNFVPLAPDRALAVLVGMDGSVENRVVPMGGGTSAVALAEVGNYLSARLSGLTLAEAESRLRAEIADRRQALDAAAAELVARGLADWSEDHAQRPVLIVRGQANLIDEAAAADLERVRKLLDELEDRQEIARLLEGAREGQGAASSSAAKTACSPFQAPASSPRPIAGAKGRWSALLGLSGRRD